MTRMYRKNMTRERLERLTAFRMTQDEAEFITFLSEASGLSRSTVIRCAVKGLRKAVVRYAEYKEETTGCQA